MFFNDYIKAKSLLYLNDYSFDLKEEYDGVLQYENPVLILTFIYDYKNSFEVNVNVKFKEDGSVYSLAGIQKYFSKGQIVNTTFQISDRVILKRWINDTFFFLDIFLSLLIENAHAVNKELKKQVNTEISTYNALRDEKFAKADVEKFWNNKDYSQLVKFLNMHSQYLEGSILKKYQYALKMIRGKKQLTNS